MNLLYGALWDLVIFDIFQHLHKSYMFARNTQIRQTDSEAYVGGKNRNAPGRWNLRWFSFHSSSYVVRQSAIPHRLFCHILYESRASIGSDMAKFVSPLGQTTSFDLSSIGEKNSTTLKPRAPRYQHVKKLPCCDYGPLTSL